MLKNLKSLKSIIRQKENEFDIKAIWLGFTVSLGVWFIALVLGLIWLVINGEGIFWYSVYVYVMGIAGVFAGGLSAGARSLAKGWLHGLLVGIILGILGAIVNLEILPYTYTWSGLARQIVLWILWGLAGGHVGSHYQTGFAHKNAVKTARLPIRRFDKAE